MQLFRASVIFEANIEVNGSSFLTIYGKHPNGYFCCIPNWGVSCEMAEPNDTFFNGCKLNEVLKNTNDANDVAREIKNIFNDITQKIQHPLKKEDVFEKIEIKSLYGRTVYTGKIKPEYKDIITTKDVAMICDDYSYNFGDDTTINPDGTFRCTIWVD